MEDTQKSNIVKPVQPETNAYSFSNIKDCDPKIRYLMSYYGY
jgi:hypothetical protein